MNRAAAAARFEAIDRGFEPRDVGVADDRLRHARRELSAGSASCAPSAKRSR